MGSLYRVQNKFLHTFNTFTIYSKLHCVTLPVHRTDVPVHQPRLTYTSTDLGSGSAIQLTVLDQRPLKQVLGHGLAQMFLTKQDVGAVIERALEEGLSRMGFRLVPGPDASATTLIVELSYLDFKAFAIQKPGLTCLSGECAGVYWWAGLRRVGHESLARLLDTSIVYT
jgi:hypothetical protein